MGGPRKLLVLLEDRATGEERTIEIDLDTRLEFDIDAYLANEAVFNPPTSPRAHPVTREEARQLATILGGIATPKFRLELHAAISGGLGLILRAGFRGPGWLATFLKKLARSPRQTISETGTDRFAEFIARQIAREIQIEPQMVARGPQLGKAIRKAVAVLGPLRDGSGGEVLGGLIKRGEPGNEARAILCETLITIARDQGSDLRLPQRDDSRGAVATTPFLEFARAVIALLVERGRVVLAARGDIPEEQRRRVLARLAGYEGLIREERRGRLIQALEKARATILRETPIWRSLLE